MFGLFKKRQPDPAKGHQFQTFFATRWVQSALANSIAGFSGAMLCGDGSQVLTNAWKKMWQTNLPKEPMMQPDGLNVSAFQEHGRLLVLIIFPSPQAVGGVYFGIAVLGPCEDPQWGPDARENLPYRYFVLMRTTGGTAIEEWTTETPVALGEGPEPEPTLFAEWVLNQAVRSTGDTTVTLRGGSDDAMAAAIARAQSELPVVLERFLAGEFHDMGFTVKVQVRDGEDTEHFWLSNTSYADGRFSGVIDAEPQSVSNVKRGDSWAAPIEDVSDWMYAQDRKMRGNYTLRALLPRLPPEQAAKYRQILGAEGP